MVSSILPGHISIIYDFPNMVGLTPLFSDKQILLHSTNQTTSFFSQRKIAFQDILLVGWSPQFGCAGSFFFVGRYLLEEFPIQAESEVSKSSPPAEVHTTTASSGSEDGFPYLGEPHAVSNAGEFHGDLRSRWRNAGNIIDFRAVALITRRWKTLESIDLRAKSWGFM